MSHYTASKVEKRAKPPPANGGRLSKAEREAIHAAARRCEQRAQEVKP